MEVRKRCEHGAGSEDVYDRIRRSPTQDIPLKRMAGWPSTLYRPHKATWPPRAARPGGAGGGENDHRPELRLSLRVRGYRARLAQSAVYPMPVHTTHAAGRTRAYAASRTFPFEIRLVARNVGDTTNRNPIIRCARTCVAPDVRETRGEATRAHAAPTCTARLRVTS